MVGRYGGKVPPWYTGQCPLIDDGRVILAPGGEKVLMTALDIEDGKTVWETPNPGPWRMSHASIAVMDYAGRRMYVYCAGNGREGGIFGIDAADGKLLWQLSPWKLRFPVVSPLPVGDGRVFWAGGYGVGSLMIQVSQAGGKFKADVLWRVKADVFGCEQQTPIFYKGHIYGLREDGELACLNLQGEVLWTSGAGNRFGDKGRGPMMIVDGMIIVLDGEGWLSLVKASPVSFKPLARRRVLDGPEAWGPMALAGGKLIVRDLYRMVCLDLAAAK